MRVRARKKLLATAVLFALAAQVKPIGAAEVVCVEYYGHAAIDQNAAKTFWPSGFLPSAASCQKALIRGTLERGDYERFRTFYRQHHRALSSLFLVSPGGDAEEAMRIGRLLRRYLVPVQAPIQAFGKFELTHIKEKGFELLCQGPSCACASACALIWFGAVDRLGTIGLHRPTISDAQFAALPPADASTLYKQALQRISRYLEEMEAPRSLIDSMVATSSSEIRWVDAFNERLQHPPSFVEWTDASCGGLASRETEVFGQLSYRQANGQPLAEHELRLKEALELRWSDGPCAWVR